MQARVYVAAPFGRGPFVAGAVHPALAARGFACTSSWVASASGAPERLDELPLERVRAIAERNDADLAGSDVVIVLGEAGTGREMYAEARIAIALGLPVVWVGPPFPLSAYREGVVRVRDVEAALATVEALTRATHVTHAALATSTARPTSAPGMGTRR
jgi:hypothetical protein